MNNFLITAMGRSGTKFLATLMNMSRVWTVKHEPNGSADMDINLKEVQGRFNQDYYGEVNSYLRYKADEIKVEKYGVILRSPIAIWMSIANRHPKEKWAEDLKDLERSIIRLLYYSALNRFLTIDFKRMTSDIDYLIDLLNYFGVNDISKNDISLEKINETKDRKYYSLEQFNSHIQDTLLDLENKMRIFMGD